MYCFKCGNQLSDDAKFCANCGAKVSEDNLTRNIELKNTETSDKNETVQVTIDKTGNIANGNLSSNGGNTNDKVNPLFLGGNNVKNGGEKKERTTRDFKNGVIITNKEKSILMEKHKINYLPLGPFRRAVQP